MKIKFGDKLREVRRSKGLTLKQVSEKSKIDLTYLSKIENNWTGVPEKGTIDKLFDALSINQTDKEELLSLANQYPSDLKDFVQNKSNFGVFRSLKGMDAQEIEALIEEIKKRKANS